MTIPSWRYWSSNCTHIMCTCKCDGVGSQMQGKLSAYAFAMASRRTYVHTPMVVSYGHFPEDQTDRILAELENLFNLGQDEMSISEAANANITVCSVEHCHTYMDEGGNTCYESVKHEMLRKYLSSPKPPLPFDLSKLTIALHVRRGDVDVARESGRFLQNDHYARALDAIKLGLPPELRHNLDIALFSEGNASHFRSITSTHQDVQLNLNTDIPQTLHSLISADILVLSKSSFSYLAGLYNPGVVIYSDFWHAPLSNWVKVGRTAKGGRRVSDWSQVIDYLRLPSTTDFLINRLRSRNH